MRQVKVKTRDLIPEILDRISGGETLRKICQSYGIHFPHVLQIVNRDPQLKEAYQIARKAQAETLVDEIREVVNSDINPMKARNIADNYRWIASKLNKEVFGDHIQVETTASISITEALTEAKARIKRSIRDQGETVDAQVIEVKEKNEAGLTDTESDTSLPIDIFS